MPTHFETTRNHDRQGYYNNNHTDNDANVDSKSEQRKNSLDHFRRREIKKKAALQSWKAAGPPMFIREMSGMSVVSDFTSDTAYREISKNDRPEIKKRMSEIKECSMQSVSVGFNVDDDQDTKSIPPILPNADIATTSTVKDPPPSDYVRQLEIDLIALKMKMAHAQSQIEEHAFFAKREQTTLREYQERIENEKQRLQQENTQLRLELEEQREVSEKLMLTIKEQNRMIGGMNSDERSSGEIGRTKSRFAQKECTVAY